ncbi:DUF1800 domain-containing protein, partial [Methyloversatilis sp. XJ19-13]|uniref:DUF1800 domain-containing protein n=1 Tax=Methyloversatilis sp. XJ19-13 TaxID=2963430 RepID=UPI00211B7AA0
AGLGTKRYVVRATSPIDGSAKDSTAYTVGGGYTFVVGTAALNVVVIDAVTGLVMKTQEVNAYELDAAGGMVWRAKQTTDASGKAAFDLEGLVSGKTFKLGGMFYENWEVSDPISSAGSYEFRVGTDHDRVPPSIEISQPVSNKAISKNGFKLQGLASDDRSISSVSVSISLPSGRTINSAATHQPAGGVWYFTSPALGDEVAGLVTVTATAIDKGKNEARAAVRLNLVNDVTQPTLSIQSHPDGSKVPLRGFVINGRLADDTASPSLFVSVTGGGASEIVDRVVDVDDASGKWAVTFAPEQVFSIQPLQVTFKAKDASGNEVSRRIALSPDGLFDQAWHVVQRTSHGTANFNEVIAQGSANHIARQLNPEDIDNSALEQRRSGWPTDGTHVATRFVRDSTYSNRQLREVMTWFWENHFNTAFQSHLNSEFEKNETEAFRANALGSFRQLVGESARSPAMIYTLDSLRNMKGRPNENYARELMELHSMGVTGGYTDRDVVEVARAFTGWTVKDGIFFFDATKHDTGAKMVLGQTIAAGGGQSDGEKVLDLVAAHPSTARFICRKLVTLFVSDVPVESLVTRCAATFTAHQASPDQMKQVVAMILNSPEFLGTTYRGTKLKTPIEFVIGAVRQFGGENAGDDISLEIHRQGMSLFMNPSPTGFGETGTSWLSTSMLQTRARFADRLLSYSPAVSQTQFNLSARMADEGFVTAEGVAGRMLEWTLGPTFLSRHRQLAIDVLTENGSYPYFPSAPDAEMRLRRLGKALMMLPEYQFQ